MKKMTMLLGSPRLRGNSAQIAEAYAEGASGKYEVTKFEMAKLKLSGCIDCRQCWSKGSHCVIDDDMKSIYPALEEADLLVYVSPVYFYTWTMQIKPAWDRLIPFFSQNAPRKLGPKRVSLIATAGDNETEAFEGMLRSFRTSGALMGWKVVDEILAPGLYGADDVKTKGDWLEKAKRLGGALD